MNVSPALPQFVEPNAAAASGNSGQEPVFGKVFEQAVRDVASEKSPKGNAGSKGEAESGEPGKGASKSGGTSRSAASAAKDGSALRGGRSLVAGEPIAAISKDDRTAASLVAALGHEAKASGRSHGAQKREAKDENAMKEDGGTVSQKGAGDLLAQLLSPADALRTVDPKLMATGAGATGDAVAPEAVPELAERLVITPMSLKATAKPQGADAASARGNVGLEVLHMETHFEPNADDFVLVEGHAAGGAKAGDATKTTDAAAKSEPKLSFDEALARLSEQQGALSGQSSDGGAAGDGSTRDRGARNAGRSADARNGAVASSAGTAKAVAADEARAASASGDAAMPAPQQGIASMTSQVANRVIDALASSGTPERTADAPEGETHIRMKAGGAALKTLTIQLQPENLGTLEVSMRLVDGQLTLELAASQSNTAKVLGEDRAGLKKLLEHAGFSMDDASISIVMRDPTAGRAQASGLGDPGGSGQASAQTASQNAGQGTGQQGAGQQGAGTGAGRGGQPRSGAVPIPEATLGAISPAPVLNGPQRSRNVFL